MKNIIIIATAFIFSGCAYSANHTVLDNSNTDSDLTCDQIQMQIVEAKEIIAGVEQDKTDVTGRDMIDGLLYFPFNIPVKKSNYNKATQAAKERIEILNQLLEEKNCVLLDK